jgi:hypothetical protein
MAGTSPASFGPRSSQFLNAEVRWTWSAAEQQMKGGVEIDIEHAPKSCFVGFGHSMSAVKAAHRVREHVEPAKTGDHLIN